LSSKDNETYSTNEEALLRQLPAELKAEVAKYTYKNVFQKIKLFQNKDPSFVLGFLPLLNKHKLEANEILYREDQIADQLYFLISGRIKMITKEGYIFRNYVEGSYFGEIEILSDKVNFFN
jgi:signal-transduction protein with cAMP-binding, CBS, and nucleotidyltransferase domain